MYKGFDLKFIEQLKNKNDLVDVISKYVKIEKKGHNYWACCPFHHEKTPSFSINEDGQYYHCFGCGVGGDVITFIREIESLDYVEAVKFLAERAKIPLPEMTMDNEEIVKIHKKKERILALLKDTARFYSANLNSGNADNHIEYILNRKISSTIIRKFGIGASLNFDSLPKHLQTLGYTTDEMLESGVVDIKNGKIFDSLHGRLIFPIINAMGDVIAFGGRILEKTDFAKYKNTRETLVFFKSKNLYNINLLKKQKQESGINNIIMVEGYMDTVSLYEAGFTNVVASMGTSLTKDQARLLKRYSDNVVISYDGDSAGNKATLRGLEILSDENINVKVVSMPEGLDPDDVIKKFGREGYQKYIDEAMPLIDYKIEILKKDFNINHIDEKRNYVVKVLKVIKEMQSASLQEEFLKKLRDETGITYESLKRDLDNVKVVESPKTLMVRQIEKVDSLLQAKRCLLAAVLFNKRFSDGFLVESIDFDNIVHIQIASYIKKQKETNSKIKPSMLFEIIGEDGQQEVDKILSLGVDDILNNENSKKYFTDCLKQVKTEILTIQIKELSILADNETDLELKTKITETLKNKIKDQIALK